MDGVYFFWYFASLAQIEGDVCALGRERSKLMANRSNSPQNSILIQCRERHKVYIAEELAGVDAGDRNVQSTFTVKRTAKQNQHLRLWCKVGQCCRLCVRVTTLPPTPPVVVPSAQSEGCY